MKYNFAWAVVDFGAVEEEERLVVEALRRLVASRVPGGDYKRLDRSIGKGASGWTWKFLNSHPGLGTPTLRTILRVLKALAIEPGQFFAEALPPPGATALEEARAASAAYEAAWREMRFWVFAGGLTNVQTVITVTDTANGTVKTYANPQGTAFQPIQDTSAFATCP